jgi:hypothetical protein
MRHAIATLLACTLAACGSSLLTDTGAPPGGTGGPSLAGSYTLRTVDGKPVPAVMGDSTILSGLLTVSDSGWQGLIVVRYAQGGSQATPGDSLPQSGRYVVSGATVTFLDGGATAYRGTFTSTSFNLTSPTSSFVFTK